MPPPQGDMDPDYSFFDGNCHIQCCKLGAELSAMCSCRPHKSCTLWCSVGLKHLVYGSTYYLLRTECAMCLPLCNGSG